MGTGSTCSPDLPIPANLGVKMEIDDRTAQKIKSIYNRYWSGNITADEALNELELIINGVDDDE